MKHALLLVFAMIAPTKPTADLVYRFGNSDGKTNDWSAITDTVMGGLTTASLTYSDNALVLTGNLSLKNYGGFASVRSRFGSFDLSHYSGVTITYKASNQRFAFTLDRSQNWTQPNYKAPLTASETNTYSEETLYFADFKEYQIGEATGNSLAASQLSSILRLGFITTEKKEGPFTLEVREVRFVR